jgi:hypothetical protein
MVKICLCFKGTCCFYLQGRRNTVQTDEAGSSDPVKFVSDCDIIRQKAVTSNTMAQFITADWKGTYPPLLVSDTAMTICG